MSGPQVVKTEGLRGIFRGLGTTICREVPGFGTYFFTYELLTRSAGQYGVPGTRVSTSHMLLAGGLSGTLSWVITYPIDVVKSRLQVDGMGGVYRYSGFMDCLKKSIQAEGYCVMTRGLGSTVLRAFPTNAATFTVVTWVIRWADANCVETTSGYIVADLIDLTAPRASQDQTRTNDDRGLGIKAFGLLDSMEYNEKYMKSVFQWRKTVLHNCMGSNVFFSQQFISRSSHDYLSGKGDKSQNYCCDNIKEDVCLQTRLFEGVNVESVEKGKVQELNKDVYTEEQGDAERHKSTDSKAEKEPNTYEHINVYHNSSVR